MSSDADQTNITSSSLLSTDLNAELHARPSLYFTGAAFVGHIALLPGHYPQSLLFCGASPTRGMSSDLKSNFPHIDLFCCPAFGFRDSLISTTNGFV